MNVRKIIKTFNQNVRKYIQKFEFFNKIQDNKITNKHEQTGLRLYHRLLVSNHIFIDYTNEIRVEICLSLTLTYFIYFCMSYVSRKFVNNFEILFFLSLIFT